MIAVIVAVTASTLAVARGIVALSTTSQTGD